MLERDPYPRVNHVQTTSRPVFQAFWEIPSYKQPIEHHTGKIWHFSEEEKRHLLLATAAFTLALGLMVTGGIFGLLRTGFSAWLITIVVMMPVMLFAVGPAFLLHEIGHKVVAKKYGCWAEFRADPKGLKVGVAIAAILGVVFMAPGAVMVAGLVTRRQNGHIAIAGPMVNFGLFLVGIPLGAILIALSGANGDVTAILVGNSLNYKLLIWLVIKFWLTANLVLGMFNMLPFGPLDGLKVKAWSEVAFWAMLGVFAVPLILWWFGDVWNPMDLVSSLASKI
jgi:Zn-dependent protease